MYNNAKEVPMTKDLGLPINPQLSLGHEDFFNLESEKVSERPVHFGVDTFALTEDVCGRRIAAVGDYDELGTDRLNERTFKRHSATVPFDHLNAHGLFAHDQQFQAEEIDDSESEIQPDDEARFDPHW